MKRTGDEHTHQPPRGQPHPARSGAPQLLFIGLTLLTGCTTTRQELTLEVRPLSDHAWYVAGRVDEHSVLRREVDRAEGEHARAPSGAGSPSNPRLPVFAVLASDSLQPVPAEPWVVDGVPLARVRALGRALPVAIEPRPLLQSPGDAGAFLFERDHRVWLLDASGRLHQLTADTTGRYRFADLFGRQREGEVILYWAADPLWSPDGQLAAYLTNRESVLAGTRGQSLWIVDVASGVERPLLADPGRSYRHVGWLGDDVLFFGDAAPGVWAVNPRTGVRRLVSDGYVTATTRGGSAVAITRGDSVIVSMPRDSVALPAPPAGFRYASDAEFSPAGGRLAIGLSDGRGGSQLRVFELSSRRTATLAYPDSLSPTHRPIWLDEDHVLLNGWVRHPNRAEERQPSGLSRAFLVKVRG